MRRPAPLRAAVTVTVALVLTACGAPEQAAAPSSPPAEESPARDAREETSDPAAPQEPTAAAATQEPTAPVPAGLDFVLEDLNGGQVVGAEYADRHLVLWFWAPW